MGRKRLMSASSQILRQVVDCRRLAGALIAAGSDALTAEALRVAGVPASWSVRPASVAIGGTSRLYIVAFAFLGVAAFFAFAFEAPKAPA